MCEMVSATTTTSGRPRVRNCLLHVEHVVLVCARALSGRKVSSCRVRYTRGKCVCVCMRAFDACDALVIGSVADDRNH